MPYAIRDGVKVLPEKLKIAEGAAAAIFRIDSLAKWTPREPGTSISVPRNKKP